MLNIKKTLNYSIIAGFLVSCIYLIGFLFFVLGLPSKSETYDLNNIDGLLIFTGGSKRIDTGLEILNNRGDIPVFISGVNPVVSRDKLLAKLNEKNNEEMVEIDYISRSTAENVKLSQEWAKHNNLNNLGLITSFYHIPRSLLYWKRSKNNLAIKIYPVFPDKMPALFLFREYNKYVLTILHIL